MKPLISSVLKHVGPGKEATVSGWVQSVRKMKNVAFADVSDGSGPTPLSVVFADPASAAGLSTGACVSIDGVMANSPGRQQVELQANRVNVLGPASSEYPLQKKYHSREFLRQLPHLRWKTKQSTQILQYRSWALTQLHNFFASRDVTQVNSPLITSSDCEGAGEVFELAKGAEFFGKPAYLTVSSQLHLEVYAAALSRVWNFTPAFRAEASDTNRHLSEFWLVEAELAFLDSLNDVTGFCEDMAKSLVPSGTVAENLLISKRDEEARLKLEQRWKTLSGPWTTLTYTEAVDQINATEKLPKLTWGDNLPSEHEKMLAGSIIGGPVVVTDYPTSLKPFYMKQSGPQTVACFDVLLPEIGEIVGGSMREDNYDVLHSNIVKHGMNADSMAWYLDLRKFGSFPHGGYGMGFERVVMYVTGLENIRDATGFVRGYGQLPC